MKLSDKLLKLADDFEEMAESGIRPVFDEAAYLGRVEENNEFADKARQAAITTVSSLIPPGVDFDVKIVDKGPDSEARCFTSLAIELYFVGESLDKSLELEKLMKKVYTSLAAGLDNVKFVEIIKGENNPMYNVIILIVDIEK